MSTDKLRLDELTLMRAIACLSVLMVHISAVPFDEMAGSVGTLTVFAYLNRAFKFTTPAFVFLSGVMQYYHHWETPFDYKKFMKKRFGPIFWPYLTTVFLYEGLFFLSGMNVVNLKAMLLRLLLGTSNYHLYFVIIIMQLYLLMPLILGAFRRIDEKWVLLGSLIINLTSREFLNVPYGDRFFANYLFFFVLGAYVVRHMVKMKEKLPSFLGHLAVLYGVLTAVYGSQFVGYTLNGLTYNPHLTSLTWFVFSTVAIFFLYAISLYGVKKFYKGSFKRWVDRINGASYWIYLLHPMGLYVSTYLWRKIGISSTTVTFVLNFITVVGSMLLFSVVYPKSKRCYKEFCRIILASDES